MTPLVEIKWERDESAGGDVKKCGGELGSSAAGVCVVLFSVPEKWRPLSSAGRSYRGR